MAVVDFRFRLLMKLGRIICPQYRFKWPQMDWLQDASFNAYLQKFGESDGMNSERRWMVKELLRLVEQVPGDTAECGAYEGAGSRLICEANADNKRVSRHHHIFDSFAGMSNPESLDGAFWKQGDMARGEDVVRNNLAPFDNFSLHKGWIPERFTDIADRRFAFVHIDVDLYAPTRDSLQFFYERMNDGGIIVCDDYGFTTCPGATRAVNECLANRTERMIALPSGGGFLIKGIATASNGGVQASDGVTA
jgi:O-methyltransferase